MKRKAAPPTRARFLPVLLLAALVSCPTSGPVSAQTTAEGQDVSDTLLIQRAALRHLVGTIGDPQPGPLKTVCLLIRSRDEPDGRGETNENRPPLEGLLQEEFHLRTRPMSGCVRGEGSGRPDRLFRDSETGEAAAFLQLSMPTVSGPDSATLDIGFNLGPLWGEGHRCELRRGEEEWSIVACKRTWIS